VPVFSEFMKIPSTVRKSQVEFVFFFFVQQKTELLCFLICAVLFWRGFQSEFLNSVYNFENHFRGHKGLKGYKWIMLKDNMSRP
jgi:hypothetical protein